MKRILVALLILTLLFSFSGCGLIATMLVKGINRVQSPVKVTEPANIPEQIPDEKPVAVRISPIDLMSNIWDNLEEKFFAVGGGYTTLVDNAPGLVPTADTDFLTGVLLIPEEKVHQVSAAASLMHAMNTNTFCAGAYKLGNGYDYAPFLAAVRDAIQSNRWMCGFPERLYIAAVHDCLLVIYGNGSLVDAFTSNLDELYTEVHVIYNEPINP